MPPMVNNMMNAMENSIGVVKRILPPHIVAIQLKIFTPVGIAMSIDAAPKYVSAAAPMPAANMWWLHTPHPIVPISMPE